MRKNILLLIISASTLAGCIPAAVGGGAAVGGSVSGDNRTFRVMMDDGNRAHQAEVILGADKSLQGNSNLSTAVYNHNLLLIGQVKTEELRSHAEDLVKNMDGIKHIYNQITVGEPITAYRRGLDASITTNLRARMLTTTDLKSSQFKVITEDATVYIMGLTTREQADKAVEVARHSTGVKKVVKLIEYL